MSTLLSWKALRTSGTSSSIADPNAAQYSLNLSFMGRPPLEAFSHHTAKPPPRQPGGK